MHESRNRVLVVEDDIEDIQLIREIFEEQRFLSQELFYLEHVPSYEQARKRLALDDWTFTLVDYRLASGVGRTNGMDFIRNINREGRTIPSVLMSGSDGITFDAESLKLIQEGRLRFLPKRELNWQAMYGSISDLVTLNCRVLVVDDDPDDAEIAMEYLDSYGPVRFDAQFCSSLIEARAHLTAGEYDAVLLDYHLGPETGMQLLPYIQKLEHQPRVLLCTGRTDIHMDADAVSMIGRGKLGFLCKNEMDTDALATQLLGPQGGKTN